MGAILIDVEEPHQDTKTIPLEEAIQTYMLDDADIDKLKDGGIVWYKDVALTMRLDD